MSKPKKLWALKSHTKGKHLVLRSYLNAWFPILGSWNGRILFIDAFAGPGEYEGGEEGSPIIAINSLIKHKSKHVIKAQVSFLFIEKDKARADHLTSLVNQYKHKCPAGTSIEVRHGKFDETMTDVLDDIDQRNRTLATNFLMIDPFGVSGTQMKVIERILRSSKSEVFISFMYESIKRFLTTPEFEHHLDNLFGCQLWRRALSMEDGDAKKNYLFNLYKEQLKKAGAKYVVSFDLYDHNRHIYSIFFGTQHLKGSDRMKSAIWSIDPSGEFKFVATNYNQLKLDFNNPAYKPLEECLKNKFRNKGFVTVEHIIDFVRSDETDYHSGQVKKIALKQMEKNNELEVDESTRKRKFTYPDGTLIRFK